MRVAKADDEDFKLARDFKFACEDIWGRNYSLRKDEDSWETDWDEESEDYKELMRIKKQLAYSDGKDEDDVDNRVVIYEWLRSKFKKAEGALGRVVIAADCLIDNVCDPTEDHLAFHPGFEFLHVLPEQ